MTEPTSHERATKCVEEIRRVLHGNDHGLPYAVLSNASKIIEELLTDNDRPRRADGEAMTDFDDEYDKRTLWDRLADFFVDLPSGRATDLLRDLDAALTKAEDRVALLEKVVEAVRKADESPNAEALLESWSQVVIVALSRYDKVLAALSPTTGAEK